MQLWTATIKWQCTRVLYFVKHKDTRHQTIIRIGVGGMWYIQIHTIECGNSDKQYLMQALWWMWVSTLTTWSKSLAEKRRKVTASSCSFSSLYNCKRKATCINITYVCSYSNAIDVLQRLSSIHLSACQITIHSYEHQRHSVLTRNSQQTWYTLPQSQWLDTSDLLLVCPAHLHYREILRSVLNSRYGMLIPGSQGLYNHGIVASPEVRSSTLKTETTVLLKSRMSLWGHQNIYDVSMHQMGTNTSQEISSAFSWTYHQLLLSASQHNGSCPQRHCTVSCVFKIVCSPPQHSIVLSQKGHSLWLISWKSTSLFLCYEDVTAKPKYRQTCQATGFYVGVHHVAESYPFIQRNMYSGLNQRTSNKWTETWLCRHD